nr:MAG TPA: hypothetical protein [Caudoviricetes sp.]
MIYRIFTPPVFSRLAVAVIELYAPITGRFINLCTYYSILLGVCQ